MRFLVDAQLPPALAGWLREQGHEAEHVEDVGLIASTDAAIATHAETNGAVLVTKDEDFSALRLPDRFGLLCAAETQQPERFLGGWSRGGLKSNGC